MADWLATLKDWQPLAAAIITATAALSVAFLVAYITRRREDKSAAMLLIGSLALMKVAHDTLTKLATEESLADEDHAIWLSGRLVVSMPKIIPLFEGSVARLMPTDVTLAAHLQLFISIYRVVDEVIETLKGDVDYYREYNKLLRSREDMKVDAEVLRTHFAMMAEHAKCAERLLTQLVLSNWPTIHRVRRWLVPSKQHRNCETILRKGTL